MPLSGSMLRLLLVPSGARLPGKGKRVILEMETLRVRPKAAWTSSGDYGQFATYLEPSAV